MDVPNEHAAFARKIVKQPNNQLRNLHQCYAKICCQPLQPTTTEPAQAGSPPAPEPRTIHPMRQLFTLLLLLSLTSCGFHLRGLVQLPPELTEMTVQDARPATDIAPDLQRGLENAGVQISQSAPVVLQLKAEQYGKRVLSVDSVGRAQEYGLSYTVRFLLRTEGVATELWLAEQAVTQTRDLRFDATAVLGAENEETQLREEMRRDAVLQILRRLQHARPLAVKSVNNSEPRPHPSPLPKGEGVSEIEPK